MRGPTDVPCPYCHAPVNAECKTADGRFSWGSRHKGRLRALDQAIKERDAKAQTVIIKGNTYRVHHREGKYLVVQNNVGTCRGKFYRLVNEETGDESVLFDRLEQAVDVAVLGAQGKLKGSFF
ncbi:hypothetical protein JT27_18100 [Alcaligenes faecalis]|uniref:zinc finger domain-containing protein n=1 Tax=Alcaligenes faecalis TaxID=511 RepID=UPI00052D49B5|nr:hypothetical protein [Alcaligenes faecalis]KGP00246.1 hypothetical protein JT27_18100 [Alcaligenes faecalis]